jgi:hypothetical protein
MAGVVLTFFGGDFVFISVYFELIILYHIFGGGVGK